MFHKKVNPSHFSGHTKVKFQHQRNVQQTSKKPSVTGGTPAPRTQRLDRVHSTSQLVRLAKEINFKKRPTAPTAANISGLKTTAATLALGANYAKQAVDDEDITRLTRPGHEHPDWQAFAKKTKATLPQRRTAEQQAQITQSRLAANEEDNKLPVADRVEKYIREANEAKRQKAAAQAARSKLKVLTSGLETRGDPDMEQAELALTAEERRLAPLLRSVRDAFQCSNALLLLLSPDTPEARALSTALKTALQEQDEDITLRATSPDDLPGQLLVQPFTRLSLLTDQFEAHWGAATQDQQKIEAIRAAGEEPTAEQLELAAKTQRVLLACATEIINTYENTFHRLLTVGKLFVGERNLPADQLPAVQTYGEKLLTYAAMLALPSSPPMQLKTMAHAVVEADKATTKAHAPESVSTVPSDDAVAATGQAPQLAAKPAPNNKRGERANALVAVYGLPASPIQMAGGRINRSLPPLPPLPAAT